MFKKINLFFALSIVTGGYYAQDSASISTILNNQGLGLDIVSSSSNESTFAGISKESASLLVAQKKIGNYKLPDKIDLSTTEGAFRPEGFPENEYLYYSVYDATSLMFENKSILLNQSNIRRGNCLNCSNYTNFVINQFDSNPKRSFATFGYYQPIRFSPDHRFNEQRVVRRVGIDYRKMNKTVELFTEPNSMLFFLDDISSFTRLNLDGTIASKFEIKLNEPIFWSNKGRGVIKDEATNTYYIFTETNFSYNWYSFDTKTGATKFITKMNDVWENPNFRIENGVLSYEKIKKGKVIQFQESLQ